MGLFSMSPWKWPMPLNPMDRLIVVYRDLLWLMDSPYAILLRKQKYAFAGFVRKDPFIQYDTQYGKPMSWYKGYRVEEGKGKLLNDGHNLTEFLEPRTRKTPVTGLEKDVTLYESPLFIITARNTSSWAPDDANFTWEISSREAEQFELLNNHLNEQRATMQDMSEMVQNYRIIADEMTILADQASRRSNRLKDKNAYLVKENEDVREQLSGQEKTIRELLAKVRQDEARLAQKDISATTLGTFEGKTQLDQFADVLTGVENAMRLVDQTKAAHKAGMEPEVFQEILRRLDENNVNLNAKVEALYHSFQASAPVLPKPEKEKKGKEEE